MTKNEINVMIDKYEGKLLKLKTALREAKRDNRALSVRLALLQDELTASRPATERQFQRAEQLDAELREAKRLNGFYWEENEQLHTRLQRAFPAQPKPSWQVPFQPRSVTFTPRFAPAPVGALYANGQTRSLPS